MFSHQKKRKTFPPGTFIATPARIVAILQLCLAFIAIFWMLGRPFTEETFRLKKQRALFQSIVGNQGSHPFFLELPEEKQRELQETYRKLQIYVPKTGATSSLKIAWIALSLALPILLLKKVPAAVQAIWLLPLVTLLYGIDNAYFGKNLPPSHESLLFPTEKSILLEPLTKNLLEQQTQLKKAWERYLVNVWSPTNSEKNLSFEMQLKRAEHRFAIARFEAFALDLLESPKTASPARLPALLITLYFLYHLLTAIIVTRSMTYKKSIYTKLRQC